MRAGADRSGGWRVRVAVVGVAVVILGPLAVRSGYLLHADSVAVPAQDLLPWMVGAGDAPPRSVPQDAVVAVLDNVVPGWVVQRLLVVGAVVLLGLGMVRLLATRSTVEQVAAATAAMWSTFVFERMAMGHWGLLLGVAALPWLVDALADVRRGAPGSVARAVGWAGIGSLVPTSGALVVATAAAVLLWPGSREGRRGLIALAAVISIQLVWVVPGLVNPGTTTPEASDLFGLRPEPGAGLLLTALGTGGIWSEDAAPASRAGLLGLVAPLVLVAVAAVGARALGELPRSVVGPLTALAVAGVAWAVLTATPALAGLVAAAESLPGGGLLRDAHKWLAPWLLLVSIAAGLGLGRVHRGLCRIGAPTGPAALLVVLVPVVLLPDLALGMWGRLSPVQYPTDWSAVRAELAGSAHPGDVVSWPWSSFRAYEWNARRSSLDPAPRYMPRTVVTDGRLLIDTDEGVVVIPSDDRRSTDVAHALQATDPASELRSLGIGWLVVQRGQPGSPGFPAALPPALEAGTTVHLTTPTLEVRQLRGAPAIRGDPVPGWMWLIWMVWVAVLAGAAVMSMRYWGASRPASTAG